MIETKDLIQKLFTGLATGGACHIRREVLTVNILLMTSLTQNKRVYNFIE